jgi:hypothetical protein
MELELDRFIDAEIRSAAAHRPEQSPHSIPK